MVAHWELLFLISSNYNQKDKYENPFLGPGFNND